MEKIDVKTANLYNMLEFGNFINVHICFSNEFIFLDIEINVCLVSKVEKSKDCEKIKMFYHFEVNKEENGYWANCIELKGCVTDGDTILDLEKNMEEALDLYLEDLDNLELPFPLPDSNFKTNKSPKGTPVNFKSEVELRQQENLVGKPEAKLQGFLKTNKNIYKVPVDIKKHLP